MTSLDMVAWRGLGANVDQRTDCSHRNAHFDTCDLPGRETRNIFF